MIKQNETLSDIELSETTDNSDQPKPTPATAVNVCVVCNFKKTFAQSQWWIIRFSTYKIWAGNVKKLPKPQVLRQLITF